MTVLGLAILFSEAAVAALELLDSPTIVEREPRAALVVGWSACRAGGDGFPALRSAHRDAEVVSEQLSALGYQVITLTSYRDDQGQTIGNGFLREDLFDRIDRLSRIFETSPDQGTLIFFFAGHGASAASENYLISYDTRLSDIPGTGIPLNMVIDRLQATRAKRQMLFIDACRDAPSADFQSRNGARFTFVPYETAKGYRILFSSEFGKQSMEYEQLDGGHGAFSYFLWHGLRGAAAQDSVITFESLADYVEKKVRDFTLNHAFLQEPHRGGESHGAFFIAKAAPSTEATALPFFNGAALDATPIVNEHDLAMLRTQVLAMESRVEILQRDPHSLIARSDPLAAQNVQFAEQQLRLAGETYLLAEQTYLVSKRLDQAALRYRDAAEQYQRAERNFLAAQDIVTVNAQLLELKRVLENRSKSMEQVATFLDMTDRERALLEKIRQRYDLRIRTEPVRPSDGIATSTLYFERFLDQGISVGLGVPTTATLRLSKNDQGWGKIKMEWYH